MSKLLVQEFLLSHSPNLLKAEHGVVVRPALSAPYKFSVNYHIEARDSDPLAQQCRGLVLRLSDPSREVDLDCPLGETVVLARPFDRFFNLGQEAAADVDVTAPSTTVYEKLDGSLMILHYDDIQSSWHIATRSVPEADILLNSDSYCGGFTFRTLFEYALALSLGEPEERATEAFTGFTSSLRKDRTYMFELCTPLNQIVVHHNGYSVTLLGARDTLTGKEYHPHRVECVSPIPSVACHSFSSEKELYSFVQSRSPRDFEGVVVCDSNFNRLKIKSEQYCSLSRLKDASESPRNIMVLILGEGLADLLPLLPKSRQELCLKIQDGFGVLCNEFPGKYREVFDASQKGVKGADARERRKSFAIEAKGSDIMFDVAISVYQGRSTGVLDYVKMTQEKKGLTRSFLDYLVKSSLGASG